VKLITPVDLVPNGIVQPEILLQRDCLHWPREGQQAAKSAVICGCSEYSCVCCISSRAWFYPVANEVVRPLLAFGPEDTWISRARSPPLLTQLFHSHLAESTVHINCGNGVFNVVCAQLLLWPLRMSEHAVQQPCHLVTTCRETFAILLADFGRNLCHHQLFELHPYLTLSYCVRHTHTHTHKHTHTHTHTHIIYILGMQSPFWSVCTCAISNITDVSLMTSLGCELLIPSYCLHPLHHLLCRFIFNFRFFYSILSFMV